MEPIKFFQILELRLRIALFAHPGAALVSSFRPHPAQAGLEAIMVL